MNRVEILREYINKILLNIEDVKERRNAYLHIYDVAQSCASIALQRGENVELAIMAGMLHDIYSVGKMNRKDHAHKSATLAGEILTSLKITSNDETKIICDAISVHNEEGSMHYGLNKVLIDADVLQESLYIHMFETMGDEKDKYNKLKLGFGIKLETNETSECF